MFGKNQGEISVCSASLGGGFGFYAFPPGCLVLFGTVERSCTTLADGIVSALDIRQMFTAFVFFVFWLFLKPISKL